VTEKLIRPDELPQWVPGALTVATPESAWDGMSVRGYRYAESDVGVPPMRDYMVVAYVQGVTRWTARCTAAGSTKTWVPATSPS
jgi:AraC family transcriptional regulator